MEQHRKFEKQPETPVADFNESLPEGWIENLTEAQKEAYRIRLMALAEKMKREGINDSAPWSKDWERIEGKTFAQMQPDSDDYKKAALEYEKLFGEDGRKLPKALEWFVKFIIDLRASTLAKSEMRMQAKKDGGGSRSEPSLS